MQSRFLKNAVVLGLVSAIGPFAIDMYLPALPTIATDLKASTAATQMTLMAFFVAFGVCQLIYGPVADMVGRKPPLYFGLGAVHARLDRLRAVADHRMADPVPRAPGHRCVGGDGRAARDHPRHLTPASKARG